MDLSSIVQSAVNPAASICMGKRSFIGCCNRREIGDPRLPLTGNLELFRGLARLGGELIVLLTLGFFVPV